MPRLSDLFGKAPDKLPGEEDENGHQQADAADPGDATHDEEILPLSGPEDIDMSWMHVDLGDHDA